MPFLRRDIFALLFFLFFAAFQAYADTDPIPDLIGDLPPAQKDSVLDSLYRFESSTAQNFGTLIAGGIVYDKFRSQMRATLLQIFQSKQIGPTGNANDVDRIMGKLDQILKRKANGTSFQLIGENDAKRAVMFAVNATIEQMVPSFMRQQNIHDQEQISLWRQNLQNQFNDCATRAIGPAEISAICLPRFLHFVKQNVGLATTYELARESMIDNKNAISNQRRNFLLACQTVNYKKCVGATVTAQDHSLAISPDNQTCPSVPQHGDANSCGVAVVRGTMKSVTPEVLKYLVDHQAPKGLAGKIERDTAPDVKKFNQCVDEQKDASGFNKCISDLTRTATERVVRAEVLQRKEVIKALPSEAQRQDLAQQAARTYTNCIARLESAPHKGDVNPAICETEVTNLVTRQVVHATFVSSLPGMMNVPANSPQLNQLVASADRSLKNCCKADNCSDHIMSDCIKTSMTNAANQVLRTELKAALPDDFLKSDSAKDAKHISDPRDAFIDQETKDLDRCIKKDVHDPRTTAGIDALSKCADDIKTNAPLDAAVAMLDGRIGNMLTDSQKKSLEDKLIYGKGASAGDDKSFKHCLSGSVDPNKMLACENQLMRDVAIQVANIIIPQKITESIKSRPEDYGMNQTQYQNMIERLKITNAECIQATTPMQSTPAQDDPIEHCLKKTVESAVLQMGDAKFAQEANPLIAARFDSSAKASNAQQAARYGFNLLMRTCLDHGIDDRKTTSDVYMSKTVQDCESRVECQAQGMIAADMAKGVEDALGKITDDYNGCKSKANGNKPSTEKCISTMSSAVQDMFNKYIDAATQSGVLPCSNQLQTTSGVFPLITATVIAVIKDGTKETSIETKRTLETVSTMLGGKPNEQKAARDAYLKSPESDQFTIDLIRSALGATVSSTHFAGDGDAKISDQMMREVLDEQTFHKIFKPSDVREIKESALDGVTAIAECKNNSVRINSEKLYRKILDSLLASEDFKKMLLGAFVQTGINGKVKQMGAMGFFAKVFFHNKVDWNKIRATPKGKELEAKGEIILEKLARGEPLDVNDKGEDEITVLTSDLEKVAMATH